MSLRGAEWERARVRRGNRMLYRADMLPCDCHAALAMTWLYIVLNSPLSSSYPPKPF
jgi:hypothetical protein